MYTSVEQGGFLLTGVRYVFIDIYSKLSIRQDNITKQSISSRKELYNILNTCNLNTQRLIKLIYLYLFTDSFMKISLESSEQIL